MRLRLAIATLALVILSSAGCRPAARDSAEEPNVGANAAMAVTVAKVARAPMHDQLTLLGETAALRKLTIRAPAAGRLEGFGLQVPAK